MRRALRTVALFLGVMAVWLGSCLLLYWWRPGLLDANAWIGTAVVAVLAVVNLLGNWRTVRRAKRFWKRGECAFERSLLVWMAIFHGAARTDKIADGYLAVTCACGEKLGVVPVGVVPGDKQKEIALLGENHINAAIAKLMADLEAKANAV